MVAMLGRGRGTPAVTSQPRIMGGGLLRISMPGDDSRCSGDKGASMPAVEACERADDGGPTVLPASPRLGASSPRNESAISPKTPTSNILKLSTRPNNVKLYEQAVALAKWVSNSWNWPIRISMSSKMPP